ncbi:(2Fe-2S)-binding protein [Microvirga massiliensis]|uniref:(2Fe-2S)-binding protein n=1 Tax=Microvirga massiliensis TaxID=1033741 RepID=UPI000939DE99|nr:(2Fe-2S)-binding protein [Microvirga massiliensis]
MIVCSCNVLSDGAVRACLTPGPGCPRTPAQVYECLGCSPQCGRCARSIRAIMEAALSAPSSPGSCCSSHACGGVNQSPCSDLDKVPTPVD